MKTSESGKKLLVAREGGFKLKAYKDSGGVWTIGAGNTSYLNKTKVMPGDQITLPEAVSLFLAKLPVYENAVNKLVKVPITQDQFDSLVSLVWNIGPGRFAQSKLLQYINSRQPAALIAKTFADTTTTVNGQKSKGLINRRGSEVQQFFGTIKQAVKQNKGKISIFLVIAGILVFLYSIR